MPELPEIEVVRTGLARHVAGCTITRVEVLDSHPLRHQDGGAQALVDRPTGYIPTTAVRRGKLLWLPPGDGHAPSAHPGMNGQLLVRDITAAAAPDVAPESHRVATLLANPDTLPNGRPVDLSVTEQPRYVRGISTSAHHLRVRLYLGTGLGGDNGANGDDDASAAILDLVDQRMLGSLYIVDLIPTANGVPGRTGDPWPLLPIDATHIVRNLFDPALELTGPTGVVARVCASRRTTKTRLLDQGLVSSIGDIYVDEGLREAGVHGLRPGTGFDPRVVVRTLEFIAEIMRRAPEVGGTSFDALYIDVEGAAGFFARGLDAYGRRRPECHRYKAIMVHETLGGCFHTYCPRCQARSRRHR